MYGCVQMPGGKIWKNIHWSINLVGWNFKAFFIPVGHTSVCRVMERCRQAPGGKGLTVLPWYYHDITLPRTWPGIEYGECILYFKIKRKKCQNTESEGPRCDSSSCCTFHRRAHPCHGDPKAACSLTSKSLLSSVNKVGFALFSIPCSLINLSIRNILSLPSCQEGKQKQKYGEWMMVWGWEANCGKVDF